MPACAALYIFPAMLYNIASKHLRKEAAMRPVSIRRRRCLSAALCMLYAVILLYAVMCAASGVHPSAYKYKSYLLQAQAWLRGETALAGDYPYLELAVFEGKYYVSFPPVPAIPMLLWTLIWGDNVPGGLFQKIYAAIACLVVLSELLRTGRIKWQACAAWAVLLCFGSAMLPITLVGGVWYEAQILAFLFSISAVVAIRRDHPTLACLFYALAVGCRPFSVCLGPVLLAMYLEDHRADVRASLNRLVPGVCIGLGVAALYAAYNYARFGNIFEFGHNYLPEFTRAEHGQLSLAYVAQNFSTLFFGSPVSFTDSGLSFNIFGFSMFLSCPILICGAVWFIRDAVKKRLTPAKWIILLMSAANVFLLLMHRTLGGHQFGMRYALELVPLCFAYQLLSGPRRIARWEWGLLIFGLIFNLIGGILVHV